MSEIRYEQSGDEAGIREVLLAAFPTAAEADLVDRLRQNGNLRLSIVVVEQERIVGHIACSPVTLNGLRYSPPLLGVAPLAVIPDRQRTGIGSRLMELALLECAAIRSPLVVVLGEPEFYRRFGFSAAGDSGLDNEYGAYAEFMGWQPRDPRDVTLQGLVRYSAEFAEL